MDDPKALALALFRAMTRVRKAWHAVTPTPKLNKSLFITLMTVAHADELEFFKESGLVPCGEGLTLSELAGVTHQSLPSVSQRAASLEEMGYLVRTQDATDRRIWRLQLTDEGKKLVVMAKASFEKDLLELMRRFGSENVSTLVELLEKFCDTLEEKQQEDNAPQNFTERDGQ